MTNELEKLVRQTESDLSGRARALANADRSTKGKLPRFSVAIVIWTIVVLLVAFRFDDIALLVGGPTEAKIETDLGELLQTTSASLHAYEIANGVLPPILPNPAIRGLVQYERHSDIAFTLSATIGEVTVELESNALHPRRKMDN